MKMKNPLATNSQTEVTICNNRKSFATICNNGNKAPLNKQKRPIGKPRARAYQTKPESRATEAPTLIYRCQTTTQLLSLEGCLSLFHLLPNKPYKRVKVAVGQGQ